MTNRTKTFLSKTAAATMLAVVAGASLTSGQATAAASTPAAGRSWVPAALRPPALAHYKFIRMTGPARTEVQDLRGHWLATFTDGARTVTLAGPTRTFRESTTKAAVTHNVWVRLLPAPFTGKVDSAWLTRELADRAPDVFGAAFQYTTGAKTVTGKAGNRIAGDAHYGPMTDADPHHRAEGNDWSDYLGINVSYPDGEHRTAKAVKLGSLDCSGFVRMIYGHRMGYALTLTKPQPGALPRRAIQMYESGPGVVIVTDAKKQVKNFSTLRPGDLVFFDTGQDASNDGNKVDHAGIYLGKDSQGHYRFLSSRKVADGPTMGDIAGSSRLDGTGMYATQFRAVRRL